eukprot:11541512-Ditylum_brightwellii.AAC.1
MKEGSSMEEFLGIKIDLTGDGGYKLTQTGLIKKILSTTGMLDYDPAIVPTAASGPLGPDHYGKEVQLQELWNYASAVGMLMYLASNSRPEIAFAVHQCARFTHGTKHSPKKAVLQIYK